MEVEEWPSIDFSSCSATFSWVLSLSSIGTRYHQYPYLNKEEGKKKHSQLVGKENRMRAHEYRPSSIPLHSPPRSDGVYFQSHRQHRNDTWVSLNESHLRVFDVSPRRHVSPLLDYVPPEPPGLLCNEIAGVLN